MASTIVGLNSTNKILVSSDFSKNDIGLCTIIESYTCVPDALDVFNPAINASHPSFPTMALESSDIKDLPGNLKNINLRYVGVILKDSEKYVGQDPATIPSQPTELSEEELPPPRIILQPAGKKQVRPSQATNDPDISPIFQDLRRSGQTVGDWVEFPYIVNMSYIENASIEKETAFFNDFKVGITPIPALFRGVSLPRPYIEPYKENYLGYISLNYLGTRCSAASFDRRGNVNVMSIAFRDYFIPSNI